MLFFNKLSIEIKDTLLMKYLKCRNDMYYGKIIEFESILQKWLSYVPTTFPHYTIHTIEHSKEIISQLSKLLFKDENLDKIVIQLSSTEAYILIIGALFHDAGMVVSDREKIDLLKSDEWKKYIDKGGNGYTRWTQIEKMNDLIIKDDEKGIIKDYLINMEIRFLIAELVRKKHHYRINDFMRENNNLLLNASFGNPTLSESIIKFKIISLIITNRRFVGYY